ncbi:MAG: TonB-dependent receptor plug domain-containing protein [Bacteroidales bacterium]|nr:TonB-dependent receptor plug domain-containing protein [Bacteroidales bacterium]MBD5338637.1 TonB-dependent receptor plug domain-containing protein [Bacteroides sp.]
MACGLPSLAESLKIHGKITDQEEKPVEFATIRIGGTSIGTNSDLEGNYSLSVAPKDTLEVIFSCIGFKNVTRRLIDPKGDVTLNVKLPSEATELSEVEVTGFRQNINGMQSIDKESFKTSPDVSGGSVEAMLQTMAGVNSSNEMSSQYSVRGGSFDENSVYINGIEIYRPQLVRSGQQEGLSIINPDMVGNIKFSTGGFPARYSDKMSSALDISYRDPEAIEAALSASLMGASLTFGQSSSKFSQLHGLRLKKNNSLLSSLETRGEYDPLYFDYQTNLTYKPTEKLSFNLLGNISLNHFNFKPADRETSFGTSMDTKQFRVYFDGEERDRFETYLASFNALYRLNRATSFGLSVAGFQSNELVSYDISGEYWLDQAGTGGEEGVGGELGVGKYMEHSRNRLKASVLQLALKGTTVVKRNNISYGLVFQNEKFMDRTKEWEWRDSAGYSLPTQPDGVHLIYNLSSRQDLSSTRLAAYVEDALYLETSKAYLTLNGGVRLSYWGFNKEVLVSPRVNLNIIPLNNNHWNYRAAVGLYYQSPFYKEYRMAQTDALGNSNIVLNRDIKSPMSIQFVLATDYTFRMMNRPFKLTGEAYYKQLSRLISYEYDNLKINYSGINDSKGFIAGVDFKLFGQFVPGSDSWITFSLMKTQQTLNGKKVPLPSDQRYSFGLFFTDYFPKFPKLRFSLRGVFSDGLTMTAPRITRDRAWFRAPAYKRVDVGISYQLVGAPTEGVRPYNFWRHFRSIIIGLDCFNLFDMTNVSSYYWVTDVNNLQYAVPNYLTRRQLNVRLSIEI